MTSGSYADHEGQDHLLARVRPYSVSLTWRDSLLTSTGGRRALSLGCPLEAFGHDHLC
jgi:hypothetical protein